MYLTTLVWAERRVIPIRRLVCRHTWLLIKEPDAAAAFKSVGYIQRCQDLDKDLKKKK
jgi:hypothetical protein